MIYARLKQPDGTHTPIYASAFNSAAAGDNALQCPTCDVSMVFVRGHKARGNTVDVDAHFRATAGTPHSEDCDYKDNLIRPATTKKLMQAIKDGMPILLRLNFDTGLGHYDARRDHPRMAPAHIMPDYALALGTWISQGRRAHLSVGCRDVADVLAITDKIKDIAGPDALERVYVDHHRIVQPWANFAMRDKATPIAETVIALAHASKRNFTQYIHGLPALFKVVVTDRQIGLASPENSDQQTISYLYAQEVFSTKLSLDTAIKLSPILPPPLAQQIRDSGLRTVMLVASPSLNPTIGRAVSNSLNTKGSYQGKLDPKKGFRQPHRKPVFLNLHVQAAPQLLPVATPHARVKPTQLTLGLT